MATKIWDAAAATPTGTHRIPADVSAAGSPTRYTVQQLADLYISTGVTAQALGNVTGATAISLAAGGIVTATATGNTTFSITNPPTGGSEWVLILTNGGAHTITWFTTTWAGGTAPTLTASGVDVIHFATPDGGTTWYGWHEIDESGYVASTLFDANTILAANSDNTPVAVTIAENDLVGRLAGGNIGGITLADLTADATPATGDFLLGWETGGALRKFDVGNLPSGGSPAGSSGQIQYNDASAFGAANLWRESADIIALRNGTTAQAFRVFDTYTDGSNGAYIELFPGAAGDWMQIRAVTAGTAADNYNIALTPSGTGAISAHVPDSATAGGNARGTYSLDLQRYRDSAGQVASGGNAVTFGISNTASGSTSVVSGGSTNIASGAFSAISGGRSNVASGGDSWVPGGYQATTRGLSATYAYSAGPRAEGGDAQVIGQTGRRTTAATSVIQLSTNGAAPAATTVMVLPNNSGGQFEARVSAYQSTGTGGWKIEGTCYRGANAASTAIQGATTITAFGIVAGIGAPTVDVVADTTLGAIVIQITPANTTSTYWVGKLELIQVA